MAKNVTFSSLKLKTKEEVKNITIADKQIDVKQYLPAEDKNSLLELTIQSADTGTVVNTFAIDCLFHLYIVYKYTNITFTEKQQSDPFALYDILESNGIINEVIEAIPETEYNELKENLEMMLDSYAVYRDSARGVVDKFGMFMPEQASILAEAISQMDTSKLKNVAAIADATGYPLTKVNKD